MSAAVIEYNLIVDTEKGTSRIKKVGNSFDKVGKTGETAGKRIRNAFDSIGGKITALNQGLELAKKAFRVLLVPLTNIITVGAKFETLNLQLTKVLGSAEKGKEYFAWLKEFSTSTPFKMVGLAETVIMLENFGINAKTHLTAFGDTASALSIPLTDLSLIMGKIYKKPKASMEEMLQLIEKGVPVFDILQDKLGLTAEQVGDIGRAGISGKKAFDALVKGMVEKYGGSMADLSKTWSGLISTLSDWWDQFLNKIAQSGVLDSLKSKLEGIIQKLETWSKDGTLERYAQNIGDVITGVISGIQSVVKFFLEWKDVIIMVGKIWLAYFAINKLSAIFGTFGNGLEDIASKATKLGGVLKNVFKSALWAYAITKIYEIGKALKDVIEESGNLKKSLAGHKKTFEDWTGQFKTFAKQIKNNFANIDFMDQADFKKGFFEIRQEIDKITESAKPFVDKQMDIVNLFKKIRDGNYGDVLAKDWEKYRKALLAGFKSTKEFEAFIKKSKEKALLKKKLEEEAKAKEKNIKLTKEQEEAIKKAKKAYESLASSLGILTNEGFKKLNRETTSLSSMFKYNEKQVLSNITNTEKFEKAVVDLIEKFKLAGRDVPQSLINIKSKIDETQKSFIDMIPDKVIDDIDDLNDANEEATNFIKNLDTGAKDVGETFSELPLISKKSFSDIANDIAYVTAEIAALAGSAASLAGSLADAGLVSESFAEDISMIATGAEGVAGVADGIARIASGDIVGGIMAVAEGLGKVIEAIVHLFGSDGVQMAIKRENDWMNMTEALNEKLHELAEELGNTHLATSIMLKDLMNGQVTFENFGQWVHRTREILSDYQEGMLSLSETQKIIGENFAYLVKEADRLGTHGSKEMIALIGDLKNRGIEVAEISEYIMSQLNSGISALGDYFKYAEASEADFNKALSYTSSFMASLQAEGKSAIEIVRIMGSHLDDVVAMAEENGYDTGLLSEILGMKEFVDKNQDVLAAMDAEQKMLEALGNTGYLTQESFNIAQQSAIDYYDKLIANGATEAQTMQALLPFLQKQLWYAENQNLVLDEQTKALIEKARQQGLGLEATIPHEERMIELAEKQLEVFEAMAKHMGIILPNAMDTFADSATRAFQKAGKAAGKFGDSFEDIGRGNNVINLNVPKIPKENHFATGGFFTASVPTHIIVGDGPTPEDVLIVPRDGRKRNQSISQDSGYIKVTPQNNATNNFDNNSAKGGDTYITKIYITSNTGDDTMRQIIDGLNKNRFSIKRYIKKAIA